MRSTEMTQIWDNWHLSKMTTCTIEAHLSAWFWKQSPQLFLRANHFQCWIFKNSKAGRWSLSKKTLSNWSQRQNSWCILKSYLKNLIAIWEMISAMTGSCSYKNEIKKSISIWDLFSTWNLKMQICGPQIYTMTYSQESCELLQQKGHRYVRHMFCGLCWHINKIFSQCLLCSQVSITPEKWDETSQFNSEP